MPKWLMLALCLVALATGLGALAPGAVGAQTVEQVLPADAVGLPATTLPHSLSPTGMFMAADLVVKSVMVALFAASVATWAIFSVKLVEIAISKARLGESCAMLNRLTRLTGLESARGLPSAAAQRMAGAARDELSRSAPVVDSLPATPGIRERVASHLARIEAREGKAVTSGTGILASVGSVSPFVGLFGTVWGIMNAFIGISEAQTTNLAIVAPGIAEALLATALGLVAAIPAVLAYNHLVRAIAGYRLLLADTSAAVERLVSRDLDFALLPASLDRQAPLSRTG